ncbi:MAG: DEAD/DEAH box helicase [Pirellulaceae bacterium]|nr:DEAD/DEAH box helicase [Pirellulaceae bacterium]
MEPSADNSNLPPPAEINSFEQLDLSQVMMRSLARLGYATPSPIQAQLIPIALDGRDVIGQARTGTGKTAAFSIPILELLDPLSECRNPQAMVLVPTRELAEQVHQEMVRLAYGCKTAITALAGGKQMRQQMAQLREGTQVVVGTPGRVYDHIQRKTFRTDDLWCVVLDEADRMLDIGFRPAIEKILRACPRDRQTMLLSATMPPPIKKLTERYLTDPVHINCSQSQVSVDTIEQRYISLKQEDKFDVLIKLIMREKPRQAIIFCRTKRGTDRLQRRLRETLTGAKGFEGKRIECIHGDMNQRDRDRVFADLRSGTIDLLVATDVVGRGIDVSTVSHIINFDIPMDCDDYVHRVGRTGRMGRDGIAFTFVTASEGPQLTAIELNINLLLQRDSLNDDKLVVAPPEPTESEAEPGNSDVPPVETDELPQPRRKRLFPKRAVNRRLARLGGK